MRCIDEYFAKSGAGRCSDFKDAAEAMAKVENTVYVEYSENQVGFKMFLGVSARIGNFNTENTEYSLYLEENPLIEFVELPESLLKSNLVYSNILCGVIRGALEMVCVSGRWGCDDC